MLMEKRDELEQTLLRGIHGELEVKHDERIYFLGEFKERIIRKLSINQVNEVAIYSEIRQALKDEKTAKLIINGDISNSSTRKYRELALEMDKLCTVRSDSKFKGDTGLLVVSDEAVNEEEISVEERAIRLSRLGIPLLLIQSVGKKVCNQCLRKISEKDKNELMNYEELTWMDRLGGDTCPAHYEDEQ